MLKIHPSAIVSKEAKIGDGTEIGPFALVEDDVVIGDNCYIGPQSCIYNGARIGNNVRIFQSASISHRPQDLKFGNEVTYAYVGDNTIIHEFVTIHRGTSETHETKVGSDCLLMAYVHIAHDCVIGNNVILANGVQIAGHVHIEDWASVGGMTPVHQFSKIGCHTMVGGGWRASKDVPPYILAGEEPLSYLGLNRIGLRRRGFTDQDLSDLKEAYRILYYSGYNVTNGLKVLEEKYPNHPLIKNIIEFCKSSKRGIIGGIK